MIIPEPAVIVTNREEAKIIIEKKNNKENQQQLYRPPTPFSPPSVNMKFHAATSGKNEFPTTNRNYFRPIQQNEPSGGLPIPTWITQPTSTMPPPRATVKRVRYEDLSPAPTEIYDMSEIELNEFLQEM